MVSEMTNVSDFSITRQISALSVRESPEISGFDKTYLGEISAFGQGRTQTELCL